MIPTFFLLTYLVLLFFTMKYVVDVKWTLHEVKDELAKIRKALEARKP